ncbi:hypothetical protein CONPUDRAFT_135004 [Coniophora puteana RWD-64-598 SS2]|uniref:BZIP domain-containing protein n=1 Tax=Coniophora puteana (strain RWD-64-598) TaxID=741705 RepID=A0A5M3N2E0_CONPW|nr:uncharacterized protein CONPUDRAFT_135004 [Coniophora puteana RWD-64-598 SS2]EIW85184.1 hypothetical protein CONPUDRAFT_135004 [Coniophora puteana RWD-64-598 SS2]
MSPHALHGLNVVQPVASSSDSLSGDPLATPNLPDFSAHLDLWTNLAFQSADEPSRSALPHQHDNFAQHQHLHHQQQPIHLPSSDVDLHSILSSFGIDPYLLPPSMTMPSNQNQSTSQPQQQQLQPPQQQAPVSAPQTPLPMPSLAQLLALHAAQSQVQPPQAMMPPQQPAPLTTHTTHSSPPTSHRLSPTPSAPAPAPKRQRKNTISNDQAASPIASSPASPSAADSPGSSDGVVGTEDKRRRNTAASARFRLKKKEREVALERRAKELEERVAELERECEGLRRENGWLKGLVVGVTGAGAAHQAQAQAQGVTVAK